MKHKVLFEASGSLTSHYLLKAAKEAGLKTVGSDISECAATHIADEFIIFPKHKDPTLWSVTEEELKRRTISIVIPSFDETLLAWAEKKDYFLERGVRVILSDKEVISIFQDKWLTYQFFKQHNIPTPQTSLAYEYPLVKPRAGRGGKDIYINPPKDKIVMEEGWISQELLTGQEYTIDVFCNAEHKPVYIIPRKRMMVKEGKSLNGITVEHPEIIEWVKKICEAIAFTGPINLQCFVSETGEIKFTEINPRIAGGMALGFAASENWISLIVSNLIENQPVQPKPVKFGLKMFRYYDEVFVP